MKTKLLILTLCLIVSSSLYSQVGINTDNSPPDNSAMLDVKSISKGLLPPRMTTAQQNAIASPVAGLVVYNTDAQTLYIFNGTSWVQVLPVNQNWVCGAPFMDSRDGRFYKTIPIGTQCWMTENINFGLHVNGSSNQTNNGIIEKYCYDDLESNCSIYGGFYQWNEMMNYVGSSNLNPSGIQGICPAGWHVPSDAEWNQLCIFLGGWSVSGGTLKEVGTQHWVNPNTGATNQSGFTALGAGDRENIGTYSYFGIASSCWGSSDSNSVFARYLWTCL